MEGVLEMLGKSQQQGEMQISGPQASNKQGGFGESRPVQCLLGSRRANKKGQESFEAEGELKHFHHNAPQQAGEKDESVLAVGSDLSVASVVALLNVCTKQKDLHRGAQLHTAFSSRGLFQKNVFAGNNLVNMYAKCGALAKAQNAFDELRARNLVSWNVLIAAYAQQEHGEEALNYYERMQHEGFSPDAFTFASILKACGSMGDADKGQELHSLIVRERLLEKDIVVANALVDMYAKCGALEKAQEVFDEIPTRDIVSWNALITGYAQQGHSEKALICFEHMQLGGLSPNAVTLVCVLKACGSIGALDKGKEIHGEIVKLRLLEKNILVANALVDMYAKCGELKEAQEVFDKLPVWDVVTWNGLMTGYIEHGHDEEALRCYKQMQLRGFSPNTITIVCVLKACGGIKDTEIGYKIHAQIVRAALLEKDIHVGTALVDMYAKLGTLEKVEELFEELSLCDVVSWNVLIAGYAQHEQCEEAFNCYERMQLGGFSPNASSFACILKAHGSTGVACKGQIMHASIVRQGLVENDTVVGTALVDMYANCGMLVEAQDVFDKLPVRNVVSWSALMVGFAQLGKEEAVSNLFDSMIQDGTEPNSVTFMVVLNTCSHRGLLDKGQRYFELLSKDYDIIPTSEHHTCILDLFGRAGLLQEAVALVQKMPCCRNLTMWHTLLAACRKWGNVKLGRWAFDHSIQIEERDDAAYVCMRNIYGAAGRQEEANMIEAMRLKKQAWKKPGQSWWNDLSGISHVFTAGDRRHPQSKAIYLKLECMAYKLSQEGCSPNLQRVYVQEIFNDAKCETLCGHSEMLAIACALINTPEGTPIGVVKNRRMCGDCHSATLAVSKIEARRIFVKDANCLHIFESGKCGCGDSC